MRVGLSGPVFDVTLVCGPPGAGKSAWVAARRRVSDVVVDLDAIAAALSGTAPHHDHPGVLPVAIAAFNAAVRRLGQGAPLPMQSAYVIFGGATIEQRVNAARSSHARRAVILAISADECLRRLALVGDPRPREAMEAAVRRWWADYQPHPNDEVLT